VFQKPRGHRFPLTLAFVNCCLLPCRRRPNPAKVLEAFLTWFVVTYPSCTRGDALSLAGPELVAALANFGASLFQAGAPYYRYSELLNAVAHLRPELRRSLGPCWDLGTKWLKSLPLKSHCPVSLALLRAMICVACLWGDTSFALSLWLSFVGLLRPGETCSLLTEDVKLSDECLDVPGAIVVVLRQHKSLRLSRHAGHVRVLDVRLEQLLRLFKKQRLPGRSLFGISPVVFRSRFAQILAALSCSPRLCTPAGLRAGGAIHYFRQQVSLESIQWMGRWAHLSTLRHYLRCGEVSMASFDASSRFAIFFYCNNLSTALDSLWSSHLHS
jgi:hypothetical protein